MSAFIVSDRHINTLATWATSRNGGDAVSYYWGGRHRDVRHEGAQRIASVLFAENVRSVNTRYNEHTDPAGFKYKNVPYIFDVSPVQIIKACHCLSYQSCETSDWEETEAFAILAAIERAAVRDLPGYEDAFWEIYEKEAA
jgi:hypothetical protein